MGWEFPNPLAVAIRRTAQLRGQHANRIEIRDLDDRWPEFSIVSPRQLCEAAPLRIPHEGSVRYQEGGKWNGQDRHFFDPFCRTCGRLVEGG